MKEGAKKRGRDKEEKEKGNIGIEKVKIYIDWPGRV